MTQQITLPREVVEQLMAALETCDNGSVFQQSFDMRAVDEAITAGRAALASAEPVWQPIETKPPAMEPVLMWDWRHVFVEQWWGPEFHLDKRITHWMPLPTPPKEQA